MLKTLASTLFYGRFAWPFSVLGHRKAKASWPEEAFDLTGQTWLVTGGSQGIGQAIALEANRLGGQVIAVARNPNALAELQQNASDPKRMETESLDLSSMAGIRAWADRLTQSNVEVDVLVNNVGALLGRMKMTDEGLETSVAINLLGPVLLTHRLTDTGVLSPSSAVINVSSGGMYGVPLVIDPMARPTAEGFNGVSAYAYHKRAQVSWTHQWNRTHPNGPVAYVMHPGWVDTPGVQKSLPQFRKTFRRILRTPLQGADTVVWLGAHRPTPPAQGIWLDRANRSEHAFGFTKKSTVTPQALDDYLIETLSPWL